MKRTTTLLAAGLVASSGLASVAYAQEASLYGSVRSGVYYSDQKGTDATWDLGSVDAGDLNSGDKLWSRIGVRASYDLDGGMTSGLHIEKRLDNFRTRHQNVWLQGAFGRLTLGQQGVPFYSAVTWDGAYFLGGAYDPGSRAQAITYATSTGGPFNATVGITDDNSATGGQGNGFDNYQVHDRLPTQRCFLPHSRLYQGQGGLGQLGRQHSGIGCRFQLGCGLHSEWRDNHHLRHPCRLCRRLRAILESEGRGLLLAGRLQPRAGAEYPAHRRVSKPR